MTMTRSSRFASAIALAAFAAAGAPAVASAQWAVPAPVKFDCGGASVTVRALTNGTVLLSVKRSGKQVTGQFDSKTVEAWAKSASEIFDAAAPADGITKTPVLGASNRSELALGRLQRDGSQSFSLFITDADKDNKLAFPVDVDQARHLVTVMREAAGQTRQMAMLYRRG
jgi:hypothetical protein